MRKRPESQGQPVKHNPEVLEKTANYLWPELVSKYYQLLKLRKQLEKMSLAEAHESVYVVFTSPGSGSPAQLILVELSPWLKLCLQPNDPANVVHSKWALHSLLEACNANGSITNQKTEKFKFYRVHAALGNCILVHGPFPWCNSPSSEAGLPSRWAFHQHCLSSFFLALQSCPALVVASLLQHPEKVSIIQVTSQPHAKETGSFLGPCSSSSFGCCCVWKRGSMWTRMGQQKGMQIQNTPVMNFWSFCFLASRHQNFDSALTYVRVLKDYFSF